VDGITALAYVDDIDFSAIDIIDIMAVEADFGHTVLGILRHPLMTDIAGSVIRVFVGVGVAILIMAVNAGFGNTVLGILRHHLVTDIAGLVIRGVFMVVVAILAGCAVLFRGKMGVVVEQDLARDGLKHEPGAGGLFRWFCGGCRITENPHNE
jgi:hypothetical protein